MNDSSSDTDFLHLKNHNAKIFSSFSVFDILICMISMLDSISTNSLYIFILCLNNKE